MRLQDTTCTNVTLIVPDEVIECVVGPGTGGPHYLALSRSRARGDGVGFFSYEGIYFAAAME